MAKFFMIFLSLAVFVNCCSAYLQTHQRPVARFVLQSSNGVDESSKNHVRVTRQVIGYPSQQREQTVVVVPNSANQGYRGVPNYGTNRGQTVVVTGSENGYNNPYPLLTGELGMNHYGLPY